MKNIGHLYYKEYFKNLSYEEKQGEIIFSFEKEKTSKLIEELFNLQLPFYPTPGNNEAKDTFELTTTYPGLLIGSGYNHEIGKMKDELKLGFFFDHTTGLPCIPGSSVKGVLRDACKKLDGNYILSIIEELEELKEGNREISANKEEVVNSAK